MTREDRIRQLRTRANIAESEVEKAMMELSQAVECRDFAQTALDKARFNCSCVELNDNLCIYTTTRQEELGRIGLSPGIVAETFSAAKNCPICHGTGEANGE